MKMIMNFIYYYVGPCAEPLGMETGIIEPSQITTPPQQNNKSYGRLNGNFWCGNKKWNDDFDYIQITFKSLVTLTMFQLQGKDTNKAGKIYVKYANHENAKFQCLYEDAENANKDEKERSYRVSTDFIQYLYFSFLMFLFNTYFLLLIF